MTWHQGGMQTIQMQRRRVYLLRLQRSVRGIRRRELFKGILQEDSKPICFVDPCKLLNPDWKRTRHYMRSPNAVNAYMVIVGGSHALARLL